ncbi:MAG: tetratricopeptide repeat-containing sensor histidine kinase [Bryobacterales bacterium]|nr:tetratricopeptide repeat-containing sensor histidine kinase [Bryobacterales bacterium]
MQESVLELERQVDERARMPGTEIECVNLLLKICAACRETDDWERLRGAAERARVLAESVGYRAGVAASLAHAAYVPYVLSDFQAAIPLAVEALRLAEECGARMAESQACAVLALVYWSVGDYEAAFRFGERTQAVAESVGDRVLLGFTYVVRGSIAQSFGELEEALDWAAKGQAIFSENGVKLGQARALIVQGGVYRAMGRTQEALEAVSRALRLAEESANQLGISRALNDLGAVYRDLGRTDEAVQYYLRALEIRRREGYRSAEITTLLDLAELYRQTGDVESAIREASGAAALAAELGVKPKLSQAHRVLADLFESAGNFRQAVVHLKEYQALHAAIAQDRAAARLKTSELVASLERVRAEQASLVESEKRSALANLAGTLAHEMNSPLGALQSACDSTVRCIDRLLQSWNGQGASPRISELLEILRKNAGVLTSATGRLRSVFERFRNFTELEDQEFRELDLVESLERAFTLLAIRPEIAVRRALQPLPRIFGHTAEINQVFLQLLANAEASISGPGEIRVATSSGEDQLFVEIADTGRGIDPGRLAKLFEPGFALGDSRVKASFSLFACQHIIRRHGGEIRVSSTPGLGSVFTVVLPRETMAAAHLYPPLSARPGSAGAPSLRA